MKKSLVTVLIAITLSLCASAALAQFAQAISQPYPPSLVFTLPDALTITLPQLDILL